MQSFKPEEVVCDVMAGVGPFAVPAAKKGCAVLANDLNPESAKYLDINVKNNRVSHLRYTKGWRLIDSKVTDLVRVYCEDGRDFIQKSTSRVWDQPFSAYTGPKLSRVQEEKEKKRLQKLKAEGIAIPDKEQVRQRRCISHYVMNLPDSAIQFLDAFRGILRDPTLREGYELMPMVHCHCFTRELEPDKAEADIRTVSASAIASL